jgi:hypothetical protein
MLIPATISTKTATVQRLATMLQHLVYYNIAIGHYSAMALLCYILCVIIYRLRITSAHYIIRYIYSYIHIWTTYFVISLNEYN